MKLTLPTVSLILLCNLVSAQGVWTWISGSSVINVSGVYGVQGVPSASNHPPSVYEPLEWKDKQGNFWVYSGYSNYDDNLWKFNPVTLEWTWVRGTGVSNQNPVYGIQGVPAPSNTPGLRYFGASTWVDTTGNLWLFGGLPYRNDLWKYDIGTNEWTWMKGDSIVNSMGSHGVQGVPGPFNVPGSRFECVSQWTDSLNNLWLFGGNGYGDFSGPANLNDMMKYDIGTNEWTWMKGSNTTGATPVYGTQGVSSPLNDPGARWTFTKFKDRNGSFWIFGGWDGGTLADIWRFDPDVNEWTWMSGSAIAGDTGIFLATCNFDSISHPGGRAEQRSSVTDDCGIFWTFGGRGTTNNNPFSDLWIFNPDDLEWSWMAGPAAPNQTGSYGTLGVPSASNLPPSRVGAIAWWGDDDRFYLYGGWQMVGGFMCDLWVFTPDSGCVVSCGTVPVAAFTAPNHVCPGTCTDFFNLSVNASSYQWFFTSANPSSSTDANPTSICYNTPGTYDVTLIASNSTGSDTLTLTNFITVYPQPPPQGITQSGDTLFAIQGATSYQWFLNGNIINGATSYFHVATVSGNYNVVATDDNGCEVEAVIYNVIAYSESLSASSLITLFPNPAINKLAVGNLQLAIVHCTVYDLVGNVVLTVNDQHAKTIDIDVKNLAPGLYFVEVLSGQKRFYGRFLKQ